MRARIDCWTMIRIGDVAEMRWLVQRRGMERSGRLDVPYAAMRSCHVVAPPAYNWQGNV